MRLNFHPHYLCIVNFLEDTAPSLPGDSKGLVPDAD
jgi:hypothetical protein